MRVKNDLLKLLIMGLAATLFSINVVNATAPNGPKFEFTASNNQIQLDTMYLNTMNDEVKLEIEFKNTGNAPLIVNKVDGCCGTRITEWTQKPLRPGEKGIIKVQFRVEPRPHKISRTIKATTNDPGGIKMLKINGIVTDKDKGDINLF